MDLPEKINTSFILPRKTIVLERSDRWLGKNILRAHPRNAAVIGNKPC